MSEENKSESSSDTKTSYLFRFQFVKMLKERLQSVTEDEKETDPEEIKSIVYLLRKYDAIPPPPEEFNQDKFLDRFYLNHSLGPYRYKGKLGKYFVLWKKRNEPQLKPLKHLAYITLAMMTGFLLMIFDYVTLAGNKKDVYQVQRYAEDAILIRHNNTNSGGEEEKRNEEEQSLVSDNQIPEYYKEKIYLPKIFLNRSVEYQSFEMIGLVNELYISHLDENNQWLNLFIKVEGADYELDHKLGDKDILQDDMCRWENSQVYYNEATQTTTIIFEIDLNYYVLISNMPKEEVLHIVNQMEEYK